MQNIVSLMIGLLLVVSLAGCTGDNGESTQPTPTTSIATPTQVTTTVTTPPTTMPDPGHGGNATCVPGAGERNASNATDLHYRIDEPDAADPCYQILGPASAPSGWLNVTLTNTGREPHHLLFVKLGNVTFDAFRATLQKPGPNGSMVMAAHVAGTTLYSGPQSGPGGNTTALIRLDPGAYAIVCIVPGADGKPHVMKGMIAPFQATTGLSEEVEPTPDVTITLEDYAFSLSQNLTAGDHTIKVVNDGPHHHELILVKLTGNATAKDFIAAFEPGAQGPPPIASVSGVSGMHLKQTAYFRESLTPGNWALICFEQDTPKDKFHAELGMVMDITIE